MAARGAAGQGIIRAGKQQQQWWWSTCRAQHQHDAAVGQPEHMEHQGGNATGAHSSIWALEQRNKAMAAAAAAGVHQAVGWLRAAIARWQQCCVGGKQGYGPTT